MKTIPMRMPEQKDLWSHVDKSGPPPINTPMLISFIGDEIPNDEGIQMTFGFRTEEGYVDLCDNGELMPPRYIVLGYFIAPPWKLT